MIKVTFINNDGAGFADAVECDDGTTAIELFTDQLGVNVDAGEYLIRVNREACASSKVLVDGDKMTVTPTKIDGAGGFIDS